MSKIDTWQQLALEKATKFKDKMNLSSLGEYRDKAIPFFNFTKDCFQSASAMRDHPNIIDYIDLGFWVQEYYNQYFGNGSSRMVFANSKWQSFFNEGFVPYLVDLLIQSHVGTIQNINATENYNAFITKLEDFEVGWTDNKAEIKTLWVKGAKLDKVSRAFGKLIWQRHPSKRIVVTSREGWVSIREDLNHDNFIMSQKCLEYTEYLKKFQDGRLSRSLLFYGPPGSGKSNLIRGITENLQAKSLRFEGCQNIGNNFLTEIVKVIEPDCIVLEDIDHFPKDAVTDLLDKIEEFNNENKLVFATANQVSRLDNALLRPGRFDEVIEIKYLEKEVVLKLVDNDPELYQIVKNFPVAFTVELMKRIRILGKEEALKSLTDLTDRLGNFDTVNYTLKADDNFDTTEDT